MTDSDSSYDYGFMGAMANEEFVVVQIRDRLNPKKVSTIYISPENARTMARTLTLESWKAEEWADEHPS